MDAERERSMAAALYVAPAATRDAQVEQKAKASDLNA